MVALSSLECQGSDDLTHVIMVKCVRSWSCVAGRAAAQLGSESAAPRLAAAFVPQAPGKMPSMIVKPFYCSCMEWVLVAAYPLILLTLDNMVLRNSRTFFQAERWVPGKPTTEQCRQGSGCSLSTTGLVGALVWRDSPTCVSVDSAAVTGRG